MGYSPHEPSPGPVGHGKVSNMKIVLSERARRSVQRSSFVKSSTKGGMPKAQDGETKANESPSADWSWSTIGPCEVYGLQGQLVKHSPSGRFAFERGDRVLLAVQQEWAAEIARERRWLQ